MPTIVALVDHRRGKLAAGLLLLSCVAATGCSYTITIEPALPPLPMRVASTRPRLTIAVQSTYAPFVDGALSTTDRYPRDHQLGSEDEDRYRRAFETTQQFATVKVADDRGGLHCRLTIVSGREPEHPRSLFSILFTLGMLVDDQREIVQLAATVSAPGRDEMTYRLEAKITSNARADRTALRRPRSFCGPENDVVAMLVAHMAKDGWLDATEVVR